MDLTAVDHNGAQGTVDRPRTRHTNRAVTRTGNASITVCICTHDRADGLAQTLEGLAGTTPEDVAWELLIIDNNSRDHTKAVVDGFAPHLPLRYAFEAEQGLSFARNRALGLCRSDVLVFTDDDVTIDGDWLAHYAQAAAAMPDADYFGGRVLPVWQDKRPRWLREENLPLIAGLLVRHDLGPGTRFYEDSDPLPFGASFAVRRRLFEKLGAFRCDLGVRGAVPGRGEDAEYLRRARAQGSQGAYLGSAVSHHRTDLRRLTLAYMYRYGIQKGIADVRLGDVPAHTRGAGRELVYALKGVYQLAKGRGDRFRQCVINMGIERGRRAT